MMTEKLIKARLTILILCVGEWVFAVTYLQHGDFLPIYVIVAAFVKDRLHAWHCHSAWFREDAQVKFAKGLK